jgi:hypothetical protein
MAGSTAAAREVECKLTFRSESDSPEGSGGVS